MMKGFSLKKDTKSQPKQLGFSLKKHNKPQVKANAFGSKDEEDTDKAIAIDVVDTEGQAYTESEGPPVEVSKELVIPSCGNTYIKKLEQLKNKLPEEKKLVYGINMNDGSQHRESQPAMKKEVENITGEATTLEEYEEVPVEEFGAAMLRGMGWKGSDDGDKKTTSKRRTLYLGLGAKDLGGEDDVADFNDKTYLPIKLVNRQTGQVYKENNREREHSPKRVDNSYRER